MIPKPLDQITEADIEALLEQKEPESTTLDYKRELPKDLDDFRIDVTALANTSGGHIVYGVAEEKGVPVALPGITDLDADKDGQRLEECLRHRVEPVVLGVRMVGVPKGASSRTQIYYSINYGLFSRCSQG